MSEKDKKKRKTILVVDDSTEICLMIAEGLTMRGHSAITATDCESGWERYKKNNPDLILTDLIMPGMNGIELLKKVKKDNPSVPVIILTGHGSFKSAKKAFKLKADDYLTKPFEFDELLHSIKKALEGTFWELESNRIKRIASLLEVENKRLKEKNKQLSNNENEGSKSENIDKYKTFCSSIVHSLKGELQTIGLILSVQRDSPGVSQDNIEHYNTIQRSLEHSKIILQRLFNYLEIGGPSVQPIDISDLLEKIEFLVRPRITSNIKLSITGKNSIKKLKAFADPEQLMLSVLELIDNAKKALTVKGGKIKLNIGHKDEWINISVTDNGPGISKELRKKLFKEPVQSKGGLGVGLFLCKKVISEFGCKLSLKSSSKKGSTFMIFIPIEKSEKEL